MHEYEPQSGQPDFIYESPTDLISAVRSNPSRFSETTHQIVDRLIQQTAELPDSSVPA